jgi:hypothetical protein
VRVTHTTLLAANPAFGWLQPPRGALFRADPTERGYADLAERGISPRGRTLDFYRFYQFRLESVPRFVQAAVQSSPLEGLMLVPGNGNIGPELVNHSSYWPPAIARYGMVSASWAYDSPASCKMYAETIRTAREFGGQSLIVPPLYPELHTPLQDLPMHTACLSALNDKTCPWHFAGPTDGPQRAEWMQTVFLSARLAHALTGMEHTPPLYVWCPESIAFSDLVDLNRTEAEHWAETWKQLFEANVDYGVTCAFSILEGSTVLWSCASPVLNSDEWEQMQRFLARGGRLACTSRTAPQAPDGTPLPGCEALQDRVTFVDLTPEALAALAGPASLQTDSPAVKTYPYRRGAASIHLLNNTDLTKPAVIPLPFPTEDVCTGERRDRGQTLTLGPGQYALLEEREG